MSKQELNLQFLDRLISLEYSLICESDIPSGIYVLPDLSDILQWNGVIFLRHGKYSSGVFQFKINFPRSFPNDPPSVIFQTNPFHPQIDSNGKLNLLPAFPKWTPYSDHVIDILRYTKSIFYPILTTNYINIDAFQLLLTKPKEFEKKIKKSIEKSLRLFSGNDQNSIFPFTNWNPLFDQVKKQILESQFSKKKQNEEDQENKRPTFTNKKISSEKIGELTKLISSLNKEIVK
ncbi:protein crossbronx-related [Anaeramoeba flamelloides]|uniref:Protein crossbronx-related n=1 Tax=Anaeramoeba flamelloides TaxID=1746091 RepID=A0ABQ8XSW4_9EUKA|nr:protein crossbronx-related [Anaeramoeba flamelloides]